MIWWIGARMLGKWVWFLFFVCVVLSTIWLNAMVFPNIYIHNSYQYVDVSSIYYVCLHVFMHTGDQKENTLIQ